MERLRGSAESDDRTITKCKGNNNNYKMRVSKMIAFSILGCIVVYVVFTMLYDVGDINNFNLVSLKVPSDNKNLHIRVHDWQDFLYTGDIINGTWIPKTGAHVKMYWRTKDVKQCIENREVTFNHTTIYFIGDSRLRNLYYSVVSLLMDSKLTFHIPKNLDNTTKISQKTEIYYKADNYLDRFKAILLDIVVQEDKIKKKKEERRRPSFIVLGTGAWFMRYKTMYNYTEAVFNIRNTIESLKVYLPDSVFVWTELDRVVDSKNYMWMSNDLVAKYNRIADIAFSNSCVLFWRSGREVSGMVNDWVDAVHVGRKSDDAKANLIMNAVCQKYANDERYQLLQEGI